MYCTLSFFFYREGGVGTGGASQKFYNSRDYGTKMVRNATKIGPENASDV